jgi:hypothetical protein
VTAVLDDRVPDLLDEVVRQTPPALPARRIEARARALDISPPLFLALRAVATLAALWITRHGLTTATPAGADVYGHVARTDFALDHLFPHARLDGWFPGLGAGYRLFAVNGPGLAVAAGLVRVALLGTVSTAQAFAILGSLSIAALPWAVAALSRELGATRLAAAFHGLLSLFVSFYAGGGLAGLYGPGLIAQSLALPLQVVTLALVIRAMRHGGRRTLAAAAGCVAVLALLHPISIVLLALFVPLAAGGDWIRAPARRAVRAVAVAAWATALAGFWLVPALRLRALRGPATAWLIPPLPSRLGEVLRGEVLFPRAVALAVAAAAVVTVVRAVRSPSQWRRLRPFGAAALFLTVAHLGVGHHYGPYELVVQLPTRGLALAAILALQPLAELLGDIVTALRPQLPAAPVVAAVALALCVPWQLAGLLDPHQVAIPPSAELEHAAAELHDLVPPMGRHLLVAPAPYAPVGTDEPCRWLTVASGTHSAHLYFWEATRESTAGVLAADLLVRIPPDAALPLLRRIGVTHVVATNDEQAGALLAVGGFQPVWRDGPIAIFAVVAGPAAPPPTAMLQPEALTPPSTALDATPVVQQPEHLAWEVDAGPGLQVVAAVAFDPAWEASVDGEPVAVERSVDGLVRLPVPAGQHRIDVRFTGGRADPVGVALTLLGLAAFLALARGPRPSAAGQAAGRA